MIVIDASVAIKWVVEEPGSGEAEALLATEMTFGGPDILAVEVVNILRKKVKRRELTEAQARLAAIRVFQPITRFFATSVAAADMLDLALRLDHPAYDCAYVLCARIWDAALVTADAVLARKCLDAGQRAYMLNDWQLAIA